MTALLELVDGVMKSEAAFMKQNGRNWISFYEIEERNMKLRPVKL